MTSFFEALQKHELSLTRGPTRALQINTGLLCNQGCGHCHLDCGPGRREIMDRKTAEDIVRFAGRQRFEIIDITGGAPELNPNTTWLLENCSKHSPRVLFRANLTALNLPDNSHYFELFVRHHIVIMASFPSLDSRQADAQRGKGAYTSGMDCLKRLNDLGYGHEGSGLELNLVSNPAGAFLPPGQAASEKRFKDILTRQYGVHFNHLFTMANVPLGRFAQWLKQKGLYASYLQHLADAFNPCAVSSLMCRHQISVNWEGFLFDCDFHLAAGIYPTWGMTHVNQAGNDLSEGSVIALADHCYTCTAGSGFT